MPNDATVSYEDDPEHMIIWLDSGIGDPNTYQHLKAAFSSTADPKNEIPVKLVDKDYDEILRVEGPLPVNFEGVWFLLAAFTSIERCMECFEQNQHKRIFFITSGSMGEIIVPKILPKFEHIFTDPITNEPYISIYVFCHDIKHQIQWALDYRNYIQIFNFDADVLSRMTRDIASYFVTQSKYLIIEEDPPNYSAAYHRLSWAHELYQRYSKMESDSVKEEIAEINELLQEAKEELDSSSDEDE